MIKVKKVEHIGVAVRDSSKASDFYKMLGMNLAAVEEMSDGLKVAFLPVGESQIELLEPMSPENTVAKFLEKRGEGLHHLALTVENIHGAVEELVGAGVRMIDKAPRPGAEGKLVAFVHPAASGGVLIELVEDGPGAGHGA